MLLSDDISIQDIFNQFNDLLSRVCENFVIFVIVIKSKIWFFASVKVWAIK